MPLVFKITTSDLFTKAICTAASLGARTLSSTSIGRYIDAVFQEAANYGMETTDCRSMRDAELVLKGHPDLWIYKRGEVELADATTSAIVAKRFEHDRIPVALAQCYDSPNATRALKTALQDEGVLRH